MNRTHQEAIPDDYAIFKTYRTVGQNVTLDPRGDPQSLDESYSHFSGDDPVEPVTSGLVESHANNTKLISTLLNSNSYPFGRKWSCL